tara:strand:+ start:95718 stop:95870 length:153 start_codon:yes stop_codon:yes gene_type:complete
MSEQKTTNHDESKKNGATHELELASESSESEFAHETTIQSDNADEDKKDQ